MALGYEKVDGYVIFRDGSNMTEEDFKTIVWNELYLLEKPLNIAIVALYVPVFLVAVVTNILVIIVIYRFQHLRSVTNYFLVNLSVADLLVTLICMPMAISTSITFNWFYGLFMCKFTAYLQGVAAGSSVFSIVAMSMDRYVAIRHPIVFRQFFNKRVACCVIVVIWIVAGLLFVPLLIVNTTVESNSLPDYVSYCNEIWSDDSNRQAYNICLFFALYAVPCALVLTAYISMSCKLCAPSIMNNRDGSDINLDRDSRLLQCRRRVARTLLILAFVFAVCWMPYNVLNLIIDHFDDDTQFTMKTKVTPFVLWLGHANSAANPLLYCLFSRNIRQSLWNLFHPHSNQRNSSEPLPHSGPRCRLSRRIPTPADRPNNSLPFPPLRCRDSIVMDRLSPLTPPSKKKRQEGSASFTTALLPVTAAHKGSLSKLVQLKDFNTDLRTMDRGPSICHSL